VLGQLVGYSALWVGSAVGRADLGMSVVWMDTAAVAAKPRLCVESYLDGK